MADIPDFNSASKSLIVSLISHFELPKNVGRDRKESRGEELAFGACSWPTRTRMNQKAGVEWHGAIGGQATNFATAAKFVTCPRIADACPWFYQRVRWMRPSGGAGPVRAVRSPAGPVMKPGVAERQVWPAGSK